MSLFQCVPNFSEGRRPEVVEAIAEAMRAVPEVRLIDYSADADHNRCVMTLLGTAKGVRAAMLGAARVAVAKIDLRTHRGVHPRTGAIDVLPVIPIRGANRAEAVSLARAIGFDLASQLELPVYFYEWAAVAGHIDALPELRRGGFEAFASTPLTADRAPDLGPNTAHPSAGIAIVGARSPLVAYNVNLSTSELSLARAIARRIREARDSRPELDGVRALGLMLASQNRAQVSMNLTHPDRTPLPGVFAFVREEAEKLGVEAVESEIIGVIREENLGGQPPEAIRWHAFKPTQILDSWLPKGEESALS